MRGFPSEPLHSEEEIFATSRDGASDHSEQFQQHQHKRISETLGSGDAVTMEENNEPEIEDAAVDISAMQKMLSAVSGSLLTSLLGMFFLFPQSQPLPSKAWIC